MPSTAPTMVVTDSNRDVVDAIMARIKDQAELVGKYRQIGGLNEQFASGAQWGAIALTGGIRPSMAVDDWAEGLPRIWANRTAGLLQSWAALLTGDLPTASARPASRDPLDAYRAEVSNAILAYLRQKLNTAEKVSQMVRYAGLHGTSGIKVTYDTEMDELRWDLCTIFQYVRDPTPDFRDAQWVIFIGWISLADAKRRLKAAGSDLVPTEASRKNSLNEEMKGVELVELYEKPNDDLPEGRYTAVIEGEIVQDIPNPYYFNLKGKKTYILPLFVMKVRDQRDSPFGATPVTDLIPLQRSINESYAQLMMRVRVAQPQLLLPQEFAQSFQPLTTTVIPFKRADVEMAKEIRWTMPPPPNPDLDKFLTLMRDEMMSVIGLNDTSAGNAQRAQSGAAIDSLLALDKQKNADATTSMKGVLLDLFRFSLLCVAALYPDEKKAEMAAEMATAIDLFDESDIGGVDVQLQIDSETADLKLGEARHLDQGLARQRAQQVVQDYLMGAEVLAGPDGMPALPPDTDAGSLTDAVNEAKAIALSKADQNEWQALHQLQSTIDQLAPMAPGQPPSGAPDPDVVNPDAQVDGPPATMPQQ